MSSREGVFAVDCVYTWNPRDQMTKAEKATGTGDTYAGKVEYFYCLSCDGALSMRKEYNSGSTTVPISWKRFEYDGLNLLRVDERYDDETSPPDGIDSGDPWRTLEVATHKPGALGAMLGKRVYFYSSATRRTPIRSLPASSFPHTRA